jgi:hypothetical protein
MFLIANHLLGSANRCQVRPSDLFFFNHTAIATYFSVSNLSCEVKQALRNEALAYGVKPGVFEYISATKLLY